MPNYDYRCLECKQEFTVERSMTDESKQGCVHCGGGNASRIWNLFMTATGGSTLDYGQGTFSSSSSSPSGGETKKASGCGACVSKACGTCH